MINEYYCLYLDIKKRGIFEGLENGGGGVLSIMGKMVIICLGFFCLRECGFVGLVEMKIFNKDKYKIWGFSFSSKLWRLILVDLSRERYWGFIILGGVGSFEVKFLGIKFILVIIRGILVGIGKVFIM